MRKIIKRLLGLSKKLQIGLVLLALVFSTVFAVGSTTQVEALSGGEVMSSCALENIGWIACPVIRAAARASDFAFTFISQSFMQIEVSLFTGDAGASRAWGIARNIANVLFVLFLLYVIYGILTGNGVSNASIKRMLPRFIVAAILVNFSFVLGQIAVDASNIVGSSIQAAMNNIAGDDNIIAAPDGTLGGPVGSDGYIASDGAIARVTSAVLSNPNLAWVLLVPLMAVVMSVGVITAVMIIVLIIRKVLIVALLLLAPIAFVLYLLPNTEHYFSRWFRMFAQLLMLFPVMAILLGAGQVVGSAVMSTSGDSYTVSGDQYQAANGQTVSATTSLVAIGATVLPLLGTWYAFRGAMQAMDSSVARLQNGSSRGMGGDPAKEAERMKRASQSMQRNSLLNRGSERLKRITEMQNENSSNVVGVAGNNFIRRRKKTEKTPEQQQFDQQVQARLNQIKQGVEDGEISASPQQLYVKALQGIDATEEGGIASSRGSVGLGTFESVELKATEAYLLESIGRSPESNSIDPSTFLKQQKQQDNLSQASNQNSQMQSTQQIKQNDQSYAQQNQQQAIVQALGSQSGQVNAPQSNQTVVPSDQKQLSDNKLHSRQAESDSQSVIEHGEDGISSIASGIQVGSVSGASGGGRDEQLGRPLTDKEKLQQLAGGGAVEAGETNINIAIDPSQLPIKTDSSSNSRGLQGSVNNRSAESSDGPVRNRALSSTNPSAINERIPTRLEPITDLEKKAQAIAAKHVAQSQSKAGGAESFEEELRIRAEKASLDPLRLLETRQPGKDSKDEGKEKKTE